MFIYQITNTINGKSYVGKTTKTLKERFDRHRYTSKQAKTYLHKAMQKYGSENFNIRLLEEVNGNLDDRERYWIAKLNPEYNMTSGGEGGDTSSSPNFKEAMSKYHESKCSEDYATYGMLGKKQSKKFKEAIKKSNCCPVVCEGVEYASVGEAEKAYPGINLRKRLENPRYPNFYRLKERTRRGASRG